MSYEHDYQSLISKFEALQFDFRQLQEAREGTDAAEVDKCQDIFERRVMWLLEKMVTLLAPEARD